MATASTAHLIDIASSLSSITTDTESHLHRSNRYLYLRNHNLPSLASLPQEDRDAAITGSTRSLARRLFALNLHAQVAQPLPASPYRPTSPPLLRSA